MFRGLRQSFHKLRYTTIRWYIYTTQMQNLSFYSVEEKIHYDIQKTTKRTDQVFFQEWSRQSEVADMVQIAKSLFKMDSREENAFVNILYSSSPFSREGKKIIRDYFTPRDPLPSYPSPFEILRDYARMQNYPHFTKSVSFGILFDKLMGYRNEDEPAIQTHEEEYDENNIEEDRGDSLPSVHL